MLNTPVCLSVAAKMLLIQWLLFFFFTISAHAQLVTGNAFLKGRYVEVGMAPYGLWGTTVDAPAGYHARSAMTGDGPDYKKLGWVADPDKDGWNVGTPDKYKGDYFLPANPFMGWGLTIGAARYLSERSNNGGPQTGFTAIPSGSIISVSTTSTQSQAVWQSTVGSIVVRKIVTVPADRAYFTVRTVLTNTAVVPLDNIYYFEYVNPDNDAVFQDIIAPSPDVSTVNSIVYQNPADNKTLIKALGYKTRAYLGLGSLDCRSKVVRGPAGDAFCRLGADQLYNGQGGSQFSGGDASDRDNYMAIAFKAGMIKAGDSTAVAYSYIFSEPDLDEALEQTNSLFQAGDSLYHSGTSVPACPGSTLPLFIINADALSWTWNPDPHLDVTNGTRVKVRVDNVPVTYTASATSHCGSKSIHITVRPDIPPPPVVTPDIYYCLDAPSQPLTATGSNLIWNTDPASTTGSATPPTPSTATAGTATWYVRQTSGTGCISSPAAIHVTVRHTGKIAGISKTNDIDCLNPTAGLHTAGGVSYRWEPADGLSDPAIADPVASPAGTTTYHVTVTDDKGCSDTASITVNVTPQGSYLLPNAFTPNGDGRNDCFGLQRAARSVEKLEFSIFNRMGQLVFHTTNPGECWDGTFKGQQQPTGSYVYFIKGTASCGVIDQKGTVTLVR